MSSLPFRPLEGIAIAALACVHVGCAGTKPTPVPPDWDAYLEQPVKYESRKTSPSADHHSIDGANQRAQVKRLLESIDEGQPPALPPAGLPPQQDTATAYRDSYRRAFIYFDENRYPHALRDFKRAYGLQPNCRILYNIGAVYERLGDYVNAVRLYEAFLEDSAGDVPEPPRAYVARHLEEIFPWVVRITVRSDHAETKWVINNRFAGKGTVVDYPVSAGASTVEASGTSEPRKWEQIIVVGRSEAATFVLPRPRDAASSSGGRP